MINQNNHVKIYGKTIKHILNRIKDSNKTIFVRNVLKMEKMKMIPSKNVFKCYNDYYYAMFTMIVN